MTCSLALDHREHLPPLCLANKAKTDVAASVGFGVDGCYIEQVSRRIPRAQASGTPQRRGRSLRCSRETGVDRPVDVQTDPKPPFPVLSSSTYSYTGFHLLYRPNSINPHSFRLSKHEYRFYVPD